MQKIRCILVSAIHHTRLFYEMMNRYQSMDWIDFLLSPSLSLWMANFYFDILNNNNKKRIRRDILPKKKRIFEPSVPTNIFHHLFITGNLYWFHTHTFYSIFFLLLLLFFLMWILYFICPKEHGIKIVLKFDGVAKEYIQKKNYFLCKCT